MPDAVYRFTSVQPGLLSIGAVRTNILNELKRQEQAALRMLYLTVQTWNDAPEMVSDIRYKGGDVSLEAGPDPASGKAYKKWHWLDKGTQVRRALLSEDWESKTQRGNLHAGEGYGRVIARGRRYQFRGIEPRGWSILITWRIRKTFRSDIQAAVEKGLSERKR